MKSDKLDAFIGNELTGQSLSIQCVKSLDNSRISNLSCPGRTNHPDHRMDPNPIINEFEIKTIKSENQEPKLNRKRHHKTDPIVGQGDQISNKSNNPISLISLHRITAPQKHFDAGRSTMILDSNYTGNELTTGSSTIKPMGPKSLRHFI